MLCHSWQESMGNKWESAAKVGGTAQPHTLESSPRMPLIDSDLEIKHHPRRHHHFYTFLPDTLANQTLPVQRPWCSRCQRRLYSSTPLRHWDWRYRGYSSPWQVRWRVLEYNNLEDSRLLGIPRKQTRSFQPSHHRWQYSGRSLVVWRCPNRSLHQMAWMPFAMHLSWVIWKVPRCDWFNNKRRSETPAQNMEKQNHGRSMVSSWDLPNPSILWVKLHSTPAQNGSQISGVPVPAFQWTFPNHSIDLFCSLVKFPSVWLRSIRLQVSWDFSFRDVEAGDAAGIPQQRYDTWKDLKKGPKIWG